MKTMLAISILLVSGCATRVVQDVRVEHGDLIVRDCVLINSEIWPGDCVEHRYPLVNK